MARGANTSSSSRMRKSRKTADAELFAAVMRGVKPLRTARRAPPPRPPAVRPAPAEAPPPPPVMASPPVKTTAVAPNPGIANPGIDRRTATRLRRGELAIDRRLDLHGMTEADAHAALDRFVRLARQDGVRVLLVVTGKGSVSAGGGVLRRNLPRWLTVGENAPRVLRIESAQPRHGGAGAFYVLLRRRRGADAQ